MNLRQRIESRSATIAVIGLGYVGLPLAVAFTEAGFRVVGIDVNQGKVDAINHGQSYVSDIPSEKLAALVTNDQTTGAHDQRQHIGDQRSLRPSPFALRRLSATTDYSALDYADAVIICVPTPLGKTKDPDMSYIISAADEIARRLRPGMLIVLESTTYPGTTEEVILPRLERATTPPPHHPTNGGPGTAGSSQPLQVGHDFFLAFSPERIDPGRTDYTIRNTPKVIGGVTPHCTQMAQALYSCAIEQIVPVSSPREAEMVKLLENTFRAVNIALVNEVALMCDRLGINVWEVIEAAKTKPFGFMPFYPGPGLGGHCIPIDPQYLAWKLKTLNYNARFIQLAADINFGMPQYVLGKVADALNNAGKPLKGSRVLILGVAYKADVGDLRESPALDLIHLLQAKGADVRYHDPYVPHLDVDGLNMSCATLNRDTLQTADCVVVTTAHSTYDWEWVAQHSRLIIDTRNATHNIKAASAQIARL